MLNAHRSIEKRRQQEDVYRSMEATIASDKRALQIASFEQSSAIKIDTKLRQERFREISKENQSQLLQRRKMLAELYNSEMDRWRDEVMAKIETQEDRKAR